MFVGTERDLAYADEAIDPRSHVVGRVHGNYERDTPEELARLVRPVLEANESESRMAACVEAREAIGTNAVSGIVDAWRAARDGRGRRLIVEHGYHAPSSIVGEGLEAASSDRQDSFDAVTDVIEEVIRHGGDVIVVPDGELHDLGRIALLTRY